MTSRGASRVVLTALVAAALLVAGCSASITGGHDCDGSHIEILNDTDEVRYVYIDGWYAGSLEPGEAMVRHVSCGWHYVEAYDEFDNFVDGQYVEAYCDCDSTFYWTIGLFWVVTAEEEALVPPAADPTPVPAPDRADADCPEDQDATTPAPAQCPGEAVEVF